MDIQESILCDLCSNVGKGVKTRGKMICFDCAQSDSELVREIVRAAMPELSEKLETMISNGGIR